MLRLGGVANDTSRFTSHTASPALYDTMRINKFFTEQGLCSRRAADRSGCRGAGDDQRTGGQAWGSSLDQDLVARDGTVLQRGNRPVYIKYHKPVGVTTTTELHVRRNIIAEIGHAARIFPIGRLDKDSSGLILLTNDGDIVNEILRVEHGHEREYRVEVDREFDEAFLARMAQGVMILGVRTRPCTVVRLGPGAFASSSWRVATVKSDACARCSATGSSRCIACGSCTSPRRVARGPVDGPLAEERDGLFRALGRPMSLGIGMTGQGVDQSVRSAGFGLSFGRCKDDPVRFVLSGLKDDAAAARGTR